MNLQKYSYAIERLQELKGTEYGGVVAIIEDMYRHFLKAIDIIDKLTRVNK